MPTRRFTAVFLLWLSFLTGLLGAKGVYTAEPPLGDFSAFAIEAVEDQPPSTQAASRLHTVFPYEALREEALCGNDPVNKVDVKGLAEIHLNDKYTVEVDENGMIRLGGYDTSGDSRVIPRNASEATDLQIAFFEACLNSNRLFIDRLSSLTTRKQAFGEYQIGRDKDRQIALEGAIMNELANRLDVYAEFRDSEQNLSDELFSDVGRLREMMPEVASYNMAGATDLSHLMVPHVAAFTAGEGAFMAAEERLGTGGTYAASTALILGNIRSVRNAPLRLLSKQLGNDVLDVAPNKGGKVFWSGGTPAREAAEAFAKQTGGKTLEMTKTGKFLDAITTDKTYPLLRPTWDAASKRFAKGAGASTDVFHSSSRGVRLESVWRTKEYPQLMKQGTKIKYHSAP